MQITFLHHSTFVVEINNNVFLFDFYEDSINKQEGYFHDLYNKSKNLKFFILSSHNHYDHFDRESLKFTDANFILSTDIKENLNSYLQESSSSLDKFKSLNFIKKGESIDLKGQDNENITLKAFGSTDEGVSFLLKVNDKTIFHAGDLNYWHWINESTEDEVNTYYKMYLRELNFIKKTESNFDFVFFPIDTRLEVDIDKGALLFCENFKVKHLIPMHSCGNLPLTNQSASKFKDIGVDFIPVHKRGEIIFKKD